MWCRRGRERRTASFGNPEELELLQPTGLKLLRGLDAAVFFAAGVYGFTISARSWVNEGYPFLTQGEKGKSPLAGLFFSTAFMAYGVWEACRLFKQHKT